MTEFEEMELRLELNNLRIQVEDLKKENKLIFQEYDLEYNKCRELEGKLDAMTNVMDSFDRLSNKRSELNKPFYKEMAETFKEEYESKAKDYDELWDKYQLVQKKLDIYEKSMSILSKDLAKFEGGKHRAN